MKSMLWSLLLMLLLALTPGQTPAASAQTSPQERCFPQTGRCLGGSFLLYWEQNGGLPVFGYPITAAEPELNRDSGRTHTTQWLERNRFELHDQNQPPYHVLLGRLGDDRLRQLGVDWASMPRDGGPRTGCLWFDQTRLNVCDQAAVSSGPLGFKRYWETHGLEFGDPGVSYRESLALFGLPLTQPRMETNSSGDTVLTQWFERARFEWHPNQPDQYKVLLGLLGNEVRAGLNTGPQQLARNVGATPLVAGNYIFWTEHNSATRQRTIWGYHHPTQRKFQIATAGEDELGDLASDGSMVVWVDQHEPGSPPQQIIKGYNLQTGEGFPIVRTSELNAITSVAVDQGWLYYSYASPSRQGIFGLRLSTGAERQLHPRAGSELVARESILLWHEATCTNCTPTEYALYMLRLDISGAAVTELNRDTGAFSSYDTAGGRVVWTRFPPTRNVGVHIYTLSTAQTSIIPSPTNYYSLNPRLHGSQLVWAAVPGGFGSSRVWRIMRQDLASSGSQSSTLVESTTNELRPWGTVSGQMLVYTSIRSDTHDLYLLGLK